MASSNMIILYLSLICWFNEHNHSKKIQTPIHSQCDLHRESIINLNNSKRVHVATFPTFNGHRHRPIKMLMCPPTASTANHIVNKLFRPHSSVGAAPDAGQGGIEWSSGRGIDFMACNPRWLTIDGRHRLPPVSRQSTSRPRWILSREIQ